MCLLLELTYDILYNTELLYVVIVGIKAQNETEYPKLTLCILVQ